MPCPRTHRSRSSRTGSPAGAIEVRPSPALASGACIALAYAWLGCAIAVQTHGWARAGLAAATLLLASRLLAAFVLGRGRYAVTAIVWARETWYLRSRGGWRAARLIGASTLFGPFTLLAWKDVTGRGRYGVVDAAVADRRAHAALRARLRLVTG
jgi:hypothetical protein